MIRETRHDAEPIEKRPWIPCCARSRGAQHSAQHAAAWDPQLKLAAVRRPPHSSLYHQCTGAAECCITSRLQHQLHHHDMKSVQPFGFAGGASQPLPRTAVLLLWQQPAALPWLQRAFRRPHCLNPAWVAALSKPSKNPKPCLGGGCTRGMHCVIFMSYRCPTQCTIILLSYCPFSGRTLLGHQ